MGSTSNNPTLYLGEIEFLPKDSPVATFDCTIPDDALVSIIIQDDIGRARYEEEMNLEKGDHIIELNLSDLSNGKYNAWIDVMGKTFIRNIQVECNRSNSFNLFKKFSNIFKKTYFENIFFKFK